jgi:hypothetical protein
MNGNLLQIPMASYTSPQKILSEANQRDHWRKAHTRHALQRLIAKASTIKALAECQIKPAMPIVVLLVLHSPYRLDSDNLAGAFKHVRDGITDGIQAALPNPPKDDSDRIEWAYIQRSESRSIGYEAVLFNFDERAANHAVERMRAAIEEREPGYGSVCTVWQP